MGKNKPNGFILFVREEQNRLRRAGENPNFQHLCATLGSKWASLPDDKKQKYKDRASDGSYGAGTAPTQAQPQETSQSQPTQATSEHSHPNQQEQYTTQQAPTTKSQTTPVSSMAGQAKQESKVKCEPGQYVLPSDDVKLLVKGEARGEKRTHMELELYQTPDGEQQGEAEDPYGERPNKKAKKPMGYGIPNWKNIKNSTQPDADRYFDYDLAQRRNRCKSIVETRADRIMTIPFYTFSCNVLCKYKDTNRVWRYIPVEIGIFCYSIEKGAVGNPYSVIINSGPPPNNYVNDSIDHSKATHKIGFNRHGQYPREARNDYKSIYKEMCKYTRSGERTILVADHRDIFQVESSIEWLYEKASELDKSLPKPSTWTVLPLVDYMYQVHNFVHINMLNNPVPRFTLPYYLNMLLESSMWDYEDKYMCSFHRCAENQTKWCAQSCAIRAVKCLEAIIEEIWSMFKLATEPEPEAADEVQSSPESMQDKTVSNSTTDVQVQRPGSFSSKSIQQGLQPLYRCPI